MTAGAPTLDGQAAYPASWPLRADPSRRNPAHWTSSPHGRGKPRMLAFTPEEVEEVARRLRQGETPTIIAKALGCTATAIWRRAKRMRAAGELAPAPPPRDCSCGKPLGHRGICPLGPDVVERIRQMLGEGYPNAEIAKDLGVTLSRITSYAAPIAAELRAAGVRCQCGQDLGHRGACPAFSPAIAELKARILSLLEQGKWQSEIARILGRDQSLISLYARPILARWAAEGCLCPCGKPINHVSRCSYRMAGREITKVKLRKVRVDLPRSTMTKVIYRLKRGWPLTAIAEDLTLRLTSVKAIEKAFIVGGGAAGPLQVRQRARPCEPVPEGHEAGRGAIGARARRPE